MTLYCAVSGESPIHPVASKRTGHIFEKSIIEKFIDERHSCPITGDSLDRDDLVDLKNATVVPPKPPAVTSIPAILNLLNTEWDASMLELFNMRSEMAKLRQEHTHTVFQLEAATRVIAKAVHARDVAEAEAQKLREQVIVLQTQLSIATSKSMVSSPSTPSDDVTEPPAPSTTTANATHQWPESVVKTIEDTRARLEMSRKSKKKAAAPVDATSLSQFVSAKVLPSPHNPAGIVALAMYPGHMNWVATAGVDFSIILTDIGDSFGFSADDHRVIHTLSHAHKARITGIAFAGSDSEEVVSLISTGEDGAVVLWKGTWVDGFTETHRLTHHTASVSDLAVHPSGQFVAVASTDRSWSLIQLSSGQVLGRVVAPESVTQIEFHPDGVLLATARASGSVDIWNVTTQQIQLSLPTDAVSTTLSTCKALSFSENGYHFAVADETTVHLWDLRKATEYAKVENVVGGPNAVTFDRSGSFMAVAGTNLDMYRVKKSFGHVTTISGHTGPITNVAFVAPDASCLVTVGVSQGVTVYHMPASNAMATD